MMASRFPAVNAAANLCGFSNIIGKNMKDSPIIMAPAEKHMTNSVRRCTHDRLNNSPISYESGSTTPEPARESKQRQETKAHAHREEKRAHNCASVGKTNGCTHPKHVPQ